MSLYYIGLSCLSINEFKKAERNKILSAEARRILSILADKPIDTIADAIAAEENGRPFFINNSMDFSISHSDAVVAVSFVQGKNIHETNVRTGCDIQLVQPRKNLKSIAEENFCAAEIDYIFSQDEAQLVSKRFFQIWTLKECYIKLRGLSVFDMPKVPSFISCDAPGKYFFAFNAGCSFSISFNLHELVFAGERYMLATAIEGGCGIQPEIRMFTQQEGSIGSSSPDYKLEFIAKYSI